MSSVFQQDTGIDNVFFLEKSCRKMNTIFSAVQRQQRKSDVMTSFDLTACSAVYYQVPHWSPANTHLAFDLVVELHILPKHDVWLQKYSTYSTPAAGALLLEPCFNFCVNFLNFFFFKN
jgi:hypothetical protein